MKPARFLGLVVTVGILGCERYEANDLELITAYSAKAMCSCVFVMKRSEEDCKEWVREEPNVKTLTVDRDAKRVEAQAGVLWGARARYLDARRGCVVE